MLGDLVKISLSYELRICATFEARLHRVTAQEQRERETVRVRRDNFQDGGERLRCQTVSWPN